ncbi:MAG: DnaB-like helicase C-terminal domain-containing protein [Acidobacteriaceae bacterium]|nr:DnaB-like helicase C-terminal domain-containing protein [Acidobacteriaceae bacterium]
MEAEQAVLGGLMLSPDSLDKVADKLTDDDFYRKDHRLIWRAINELANKGMPCDAITLGDWFVANENAEMVGGASYLMELANSTPSAANIGAYGDIVREKSVLRMLIDAGTSITEDGFRPEGKSVQEVMELAEQRVFRIAESGARGKKDIVSVREAVGEAFRMLTERYEKRGQLTGISTGFTDLDELTSGLQPSDLIIVAARPSMGKTAFALNLAEAAAMRGKKAVAVFSMEMSASQLAFRLISSLGRVHAQHLRNGDLAEEDWPRVTSAITMLSDAKIFIDATILKFDAGDVTVQSQVFPPGKPFHLNIGAGETLDVYQDEFRVALRVRTAPGAHTLSGVLRYQACDTASCFPPRTLPLRISVVAK